jgi:vitamin-K-epoxide reductase (warfarin-sensitive)
MKKIVNALIVFSVIGLALSLYSFLHYKGFTSGEFCTISETVNCDIVNKGPFSKIFGLPVSLIGILGYGFLVAGSILKRIKLSTDKELTIFLLAASYGALGFSLYLTYIEAFILNAWCIICVTSQLVILAFAILITLVAHRESHISNLKIWLNKLFSK